jgi:hypothetical protein
MSILTSAVFRVFSEKTAIFCCNLLFYFFGFFHEGCGTEGFIGCSDDYFFSKHEKNS